MFIQNTKRVLSLGKAASLSNKLNTPQEVVEFWVQQMESLGVDAADDIMKSLGYVEDLTGVLHKTNIDFS